MENVLHEIASAITNLDGLERVQDLVKKALSQKIPVSDIVEKGLRKGLEQVGAKYEASEYFLAELLFAASIMDGALQIVGPELKRQGIQKKGTILLGTVRGDIHDIGKNIFKMLAEGGGFEVNDLGVDVDPEAFIGRSLDSRPNTVGLSCLLSTGLHEIKNTISVLAGAKMRDQVKILIGGNAVTKEFAKEAGADAAASDAVEGVNLCRGWVKA
ncbi:MAG: cobalamin-dependent protein [Candidatus Bathyarchaeia archaeon]